ncbi:hydroxymethylglutaryl-CoA synthase [Candidatus Bathyarchaeota archaeon]|jgi:hydroxymethylglutaryl-CoA synthase|nr:hydroxymethylglutaryl-CoA synthase [Candidatus Bathyarchaeota archaeon]
MVGIVSYGVYVPRWRLKAEEIARVWGQDANVYKNGLMITEKSVPSLDEDTVTMSVEAARNCLKRAITISPKRIGAIYVGSESHPYAVKPTASIVAEAIEATPSLTAVDMEFACKAGTAGIQACLGLVKAGYIEYGLAIGSDTAQSRPSDALEYSAAAGAAAYLMGNEGVIAEIEGTYSYTKDVPDFWRRDGERYPRHAGRFTGDPAYFDQVVNCASGLMRQLHTSPDDYDYLVLHMPNGKFPLRAARILGFTEDKILPSLVVTEIGNSYSASSLIGLAAILDKAKGGDRILLTSYGSGAGSDAFSLTVTDRIREVQALAPTVRHYIDNKEYVDYALYSRFKRQFRGSYD